MIAVLPVEAGCLEQATTLMERGEHRKAADMLIAAGPTGADELILVTRALARNGDYKEAIEWGKKAIETAPESSPAHFEYARAIRVKMQNVSKFKAMFSLGTYKKELNRAIDLDPKNVEARQEQIGFLTEAPGFAGGDKKAAAEKIEELKAIDWHAGMWSQADLYRAKQETEGLIATYSEMLAEDESNHHARQSLAFTLQSQGRYREADRHFSVLLASDEPRHVQGARYQLARSRILGEYEAEVAVEQLREYIKKLGADRQGLPSESHAYWRLGLAYQQLDRIEDARQALERAVRLDGENEEARKALKQLSRG
jgi:tetratricopeptide (TPR) repeat protein